MFKFWYSFLSGSPQLDALQRTTSAFTLFNAGTKENVNPSYAEFTVNHRIHSLQNCKEVRRRKLKNLNYRKLILSYWGSWIRFKCYGWTTNRIRGNSMQRADSHLADRLTGLFTYQTYNETNLSRLNHSVW